MAVGSCPGQQRHPYSAVWVRARTEGQGSSAVCTGGEEDLRGSIPDLLHCSLVLDHCCTAAEKALIFFIGRYFFSHKVPWTIFFIIIVFPKSVFQKFFSRKTITAVQLRMTGSQAGVC